MGDSKKILVCVNTLSEVDSQAYPSHLIQAFRMGRNTKHEFQLFTPRRMAIHNARNEAVKLALSGNFDYIYFYDDDMDLHPDTLETLISRDKDIIMALCCVRGYPYLPMVFKWVEQTEADSNIMDLKVKNKLLTLWEDCMDSKNSDGLIEPVAALGCAATLIKVDVCRQLDYPWFYTGTANTEDVYFCVKAQQQLENVSLAVDTTVPAGHLLKDRQVLYPWNRLELKSQKEEYDEFLSARA